MLDKIAKILNQAENAGTEEEAAVFTEKAQELATLYGVDLAKARFATKSKEKTTPIQKTVHIGRGIKGLKTLADLFYAVARANDVKCLFAPNGSRVYAYGFAEDIDVSEAIYASLLTQQAKALEAFKRSGEWMDEKVWIEGYGQYVDEDGRPTTRRENPWAEWEWVEGKWKPQTWRTARLSFQEAYARRIGLRLREAKESQEESMVKEEVNDTTLAFGALEDTDCSTALAVIEKKRAVSEFFDPHQKRARGTYEGGHSGASSNSGRTAGRAAADKARLCPATSIGGVKGAIER